MSDLIDDRLNEIEINDDIPETEDVIEEPVMIEPFNPTEINILPRQESLHNVIERLRNDEINLNTDFQRHPNLWNQGQMSRLIESILIRFPLPAFYFDASNDDKWLVVDGLQRLSSIKKYVISKNLKLSNLEYLQDVNGKGFDDLPRAYQRRIDECSITMFLIQPGTPEEVKYSIFRRINTGGLSLNNQEIRNAMAKPEIRKYLVKLSEDRNFTATIGDQTARMLDVELVLRFISFYHMDYEASTKNITTFLDEMMEILKKSSKKDLDRFELAFKTAMKRCLDIFGDAAFEKRNLTAENRRRRKNSTLFEVWSVAVARLSESEIDKLMGNKEIVQEKHLQIMTNDDAYFRSITFSTQKREHFRIRRYKVNQIIQEVLNA